MSETTVGNPPSMVERSTSQAVELRPEGGVRQPRVGIVVLNWRRPCEILTCLSSINAQTYPAFEIIVVDNGSANGSVSEIRRRFPTVSVVENGRNLGFAGGSNVGINVLRRRGVDFVLLLNDDATCDPDLLRHLVRLAETDPDIGVLGPTIYYAGDPGTIIWSAGGTIDRLGHALHFRAGEAGGGPLPMARDVDYVTGCALLIRSDVIEKVGALDERFFAYWEEAEWCARVRAAGFRVVHVPAARVWHGFLPEDRETSHAYQYLMTRNRLLYLECVEGKGTALLLAGLDILRTALSWSLKPRHRDMRPYAGTLLRAAWDFALRRFGPPPLPV